MPDPSSDSQAALYRLIAENAHDLIALLDQAGKLLYVSPASSTVLGVAPETLVGTDYYALVHPEDVASPRASHAAVLETLDAVPTYRCRRGDGSWVRLESNARGLPDGKVLVVARDVTHRHLIEEQFLQAQKMEAIGRLAGGVAHDFNNLLSIITSAGTLLHEDLAADHPSQPLTVEIRDACRRATELTRQLLAFSRRQMLVPSVINPNALVQGVVEAVAVAFGERIRIQTELDPRVGTINVDVTQIEKVLTSFANNARDAMAGGGALIFRTGNATISASDFEATPGTPVGEYVTMEVTDTGVGMDPLTRSHLFEPFFTTKPRGKGVGLGLATAYGVVKQSNGFIRVRSEPGQGSSFSLLFPRVGAPVAAPHPSAGRPVAIGTETILLVEDDTGVRRVAAALLEKKGFRVLQAEGGNEALKLAAAEAQPANLLLTDVMMPGMTGPEIATALKRRWPTLKVLFISGYTNDSVLRAGVESSSVNFLHKPFTLEALSRRVREVLDQPTQPAEPS